MATINVEEFKQVPLPKNTVAVARADGRIYTVDFTEMPQLDDPGAIDWNVSVAKILIGKIQQSRTRFLTLEEIEIENVVRTGQLPPGAVTDTEITVFGSLDGKNNVITNKPVVTIDDGGFIQAKCRVTAHNFGIQLRGTYNMNTIQVVVHQNGRR